MVTLVNLPAAGSVAGIDLLGVDRSPSGTFATQKASINQVLGLIPMATTTAPGLVQVGAGLAIANGVLSATGSGGGSSYVLPTASTTVLGGVKVDGTSVTIANGVISAAGGGGGGTANPTFTGNITANTPGSSLILGQANVSGTSNVDFRVFGWAPNQYDVRLSASNGFINANGQGTLNIIAAQLQFNGVGFNPANYATLLNPVFIGAPTAPTPNSSDNSTKIATTAFFYNQIASSATVTSLTGGGTAGMVVVNGSDTPSVAHEYAFPVITSPANYLAAGMTFRIYVRHNATVTSVAASIPPASAGNTVQMSVLKNGGSISGLSNITVTGGAQTFTPNSPVSFAAGDKFEVIITGLTGSVPVNAGFNVQPFGVWA